MFHSVLESSYRFSFLIHAGKTVGILHKHMTAKPSFRDCSLKSFPFLGLDVAFRTQKFSDLLDLVTAFIYYRTGP